MPVINRRAALGAAVGGLLLLGLLVTFPRAGIGVALTALVVAGLVAAQRRARTQVEDALRDQARDLHAITNAVPGVVFQFQVDPGGAYRYNFTSRGMFQLLDVDASAAPTDFDAFIAFVLPEDRLGWDDVVDPQAVQPRLRARVVAPARTGVHEVRGFVAYVTCNRDRCRPRVSEVKWSVTVAP